MNNIIVDWDRFKYELEMINLQGLALDEEEWFDQMVGAAIPIKLEYGGIAYFSIHSISSRKTICQIKSEIPRMQEAELKLGKSLNKI